MSWKDRAIPVGRPTDPASDGWSIQPQEREQPAAPDWRSRAIPVQPRMESMNMEQDPDVVEYRRQVREQGNRDANVVSNTITGIGSYALSSPTISNLLTPGMRAGIGAVLGTEAIRARAASGEAQADFAQNDGYLDRTGALAERAVGSALGGADRFVSGFMPEGRAQEVFRARARPVEAAQNTAVAGETTWEDVKADPVRNLLPFIHDTAIGSAPEMAITMTPGIGMIMETGIQSGRIGQNRAVADGREDATGGDILAAAPFAAVSAALERTGELEAFGNAGGNFLSSFFRKAGTQGAFEFGQEFVENAGGTVGTEQGFNLVDTLDQSAGAALGGAGMGGGISVVQDGGRAAVNRVTGRARPQAPLSPEDRSSPLPDDLIGEGRATVGGATGDASVIMWHPVEVGRRVSVNMPDGRSRTGVLEQAGANVSVALDDGSRIDQPLDMLVDAGVKLSPADGRVNVIHPTGEQKVGSLHQQGSVVTILFEDGTQLPQSSLREIVAAGIKLVPIPGEPAQSPLAEADAIDAGLARSATSVLPVPGARPAPAARPAAPTAAPQAPAAPVGQNAREDFKARVRVSESSGRDNAANPRGSASGRYQFIESTFKTLYQRVYRANPQQAAEAWANNRFDPQVQERLMDAAIGEYSAAFRRAGIPETAGNLYLAHFLGPAGAVSALRADPRTPTINHFGEAIVNSNPEVMRGKTVGDVIAWTRRRMGGAAPAGGMDAATGEAPTMPDLQMTEFDPVDFGNGPERAPLPVIPMRAEDRQDTAVTTTGREVPVQYAVVELRDLIASNDAEGNTNPSYPAERQPRDRTRVASRSQVQDIAANLNPRLLGRSPKASDGAPIISPDGVVESGNGRTIALQLAYAQGGEKVDAYRQMIEGEGFDTSGMDQPVLVRARDANMAPEEVDAFIREANSRDTAAMSGTESAQSDADAMPAAMLDLYRGGDIDAAGNRDFVRAFMQAVVPVAEQGQMVMKDGQIAKPLLARMEAAVLVRAFGRQPFVEKLVDATDSNIRTIGKALIETGGSFAKLREASMDGRVDPAMDISNHISEAVEIVDRARRENRPVASFVQQRDIFSGETVHPLTEAVLRMMYARPDFTRPVSQKRLVEALNYYLQEAEKAAPGGGLFGESTKATPDGILQLANEKSKRTPDDGEQPDLLRTGQPDGGDGVGVPAPSRDDGGPSGTGVQAQSGSEGSGESVDPAPVKLTAPDTQSPPPFIPTRTERPSEPAATAPASTARIEPGSTDKSIVVVGANKAELAAIAEAVPNAKPTPPRKSDGGISFSKKYEDKIRAALEGVTKAVTPTSESVVGQGGESAETASPTPTADALTGDKINSEWAAFSEDSRTLGIPRADMPQVKAEHRGALTQFLAARGIKHVEKTMNPALLRPTQAEYSPAKVAKAKAYEGGDRAILVSNDGYVVDGHHQWMAAVEKMDAMSNTERALGRADIRVIELGAPIRELLDVVPQFPSAETAGGAKSAATTPKPASGGGSVDLVYVSKEGTQVRNLIPGTPAKPVSNSPYENAASDPAGKEDLSVRDLMRDDNRYMVRTGAVLTTVSGRRMSPAPKWDSSTRGKLTMSLKRQAEWLLSEAVAEVEGYGFGDPRGNARPFLRSMRVDNLSPADWYTVNDVLFGDMWGPKDRAPYTVDTPPAKRQSSGGNGVSMASTAGSEADGNRLANAGRDMVSPSAPTSAEAGRQDSPRQANAMPPASSTTGSPATSRNEGVNRSDIESSSAAGSTTNGQPSPNRLVTDDRAAELRERLKAKLNPNRLNAGIDPEIIAIGTELAVYHIEKGARRFQAFATAIAGDLGMAVTDLRKYLRSWYNGARDMMEDSGESVAGMDTPDEVGKAMRTLDQWADAAAVTPAAEPATETGNDLQGTLFAGDAGAGSEALPLFASDGATGSAPASEVAGSAQPGRTADTGRAAPTERTGAQSASPVRSGADGARTTDRVPDRVAKVKGENWRIDPGSLAESRGPMQKARDNVRAVELVKQLQAEGRVATREEQAELARYVGWGGLANIFPDTKGDYGKGFEQLGPRLKELLTDEEYATARRSTQYAHYTSEKVVRPMWDLAVRLGFNGGRVFEPGMGTGNFAGMMPADVAGSTFYYGLEFDGLTAQIAKALYPKWAVAHDDYTKTVKLVDAYDLVIGNPPFSATVVKSDPAYGKFGFLLHDFFFAKSLDSVRPGGLLMFVTSAGTMNKVDAKAREYLADRADLVGAIRLPSTAFAENAGTKVTTDIIVLRKRLPGDKAGDRSWTQTRNVPLPNRSGETVTAAVNAYFLDNPDMILGEQGMFDQLVAGDRYGVRATPGVDLEKALTDAMGRMTVDATLAPAPTPVERAQQDVDFAVEERKEGSFYLSESGDVMRLQGGVGQKVQTVGKGVKGGVSKDAMVKVKKLIGIRDALRETLAADMAGDTAKSDAARANLNKLYDKFVALHGPINKSETTFSRPTIIQQESARAKAREQARAQDMQWDEGDFDAGPLYTAGVPNAEIARERQAAREAAKAAGRTFNEGTFNPDDMDDVARVKRPNIDAFMSDQESYRLRSIEHYNDDTGQAKKGLVFFENPVTRETTPTINSPEDALLYVMNMRGRPDIDEIARLSGQSKQDVIAALSGFLYRVPGSNAYETRETYLSGNVRKKLDIARAAAEGDPDYRHNVAALEAVQPAPLSRSDITAALGMPWVPTDVIEEFGTKALGLSKLNVQYNAKLARWRVEGDSSSAAAIDEWGTQDREAPLLIWDALNRATPKIYRKSRNAEGKTESVLDESATQAVQDKLTSIKARFREWAWEDEERAGRLEELYNTEYNSLVAPKFDGAYLKTPGINAEWSWRPHQQAVVARIIQNGNTYMAHGVGAGKTSAMIGAGMEMKRLGLVNKPMYAVPNHMLGQFTKEFYEQYPTARIMVADETRFHTSRRKQFVADVANSDIDAVIITHSAFGLLPVSAEFEDNLLQEQVDEMREALAEVSDDQENRITRKQLEQQIEQLEQRQGALRNRKKDSVYSFEETGVDFLFVDEAHLFRKLGFATKMGQMKGIDPNGSQAAFDLYAKIQLLETRRPGRSAVLASGTPITNTMAEMFTVQRYLQRGLLKERGLERFDAWAGSFGDTNTRLEQDPAGGYAPVTRFSKFVNVPELSVMVRQFMDVVTSNDLDSLVVRPKLKGGKRNLVVVEQTDSQKAYQATLQRRMEAIQERKGPPQKGDDILLSVINDGRKSAIDMRLINRDNPKEGSKLERLVDNVHRIWQDSKRAGFHAITRDGYSSEPVDFGPAAQMVFADLGVNETEGKDGSRGISVHQYIRSQLVARGVPAKEIALISDFKNAVQRQRLFNDMNEGRVRILIGSVPKMGTGVNAQKRLIANHNLDPQWYPANDEQRNGRIIRQGNMNPEVEIYDYSTKGTYDSQMWSLMENKAKFIEGFMRGDPSMRDMEDLGESSQYEQAKALTTSDERIIKLTEMRQALDKAMLRRSSFDRAQATIRSRVAKAKRTVEQQTRRLGEIDADIAQRIDTQGDAFEGVAEGVTFSERAKFGEALLSKMDRMAQEKKITGKGEKIGFMGGFDLMAEARAFAGEVTVTLSIKRNGGVLTDLADTNSAVGLVASITSKLRSFEDAKRFAAFEIEESKKTVAEFEGKGNDVYQGMPEIRQLQDDIHDLEAELEKDSAKGAATGDVLEGADAAEFLNAIDRPDEYPGFKQSRSRSMPGTAEIDPVALRERLKALSLSDKVSLAIMDSLSGAAGDYGAGGQAIIRVARDTAQAGRFTLDHEAIHALREMGLFSKSEWNMLTAAAKRDAALMRSIARRYSDLDAESQLEEAVADMFARWSEGQTQKGVIARLFQRLRDLFDAIRNAVRGDGFASAGGIMRAVDRGDVGRRETDFPDLGDGQFFGGPSQSRAYENAPDGLMGFAKDGSRQKGYGQQGYRYNQPVRVTLPSGETFADEIMGLNPAHALERARRNWPDSDVQADGEGGYTARQSRIETGQALTDAVATGVRAKVDAALDVFRTKMQDRYLPLLRVQQRVESATGKPLPLGANPYLREELMTGRMGNQLERFSDNMIDPLFTALHQSGVTPEELETFLYARHAPERNAQIAKINPKMPDGGSGMSDIEAAAIMNRVKRSGRIDKLEALASMVDDINQFALKTRIDAGLLSADEAEAWQNTYQHYVPLRGQEEVKGDATGLTARVNRSGGGLTVTGKEAKRAYGRRSHADNILAYTLLQAEEAIVRAETNRVAQAFVNLAQRSPDPDYWEVNKVTRKAVMDSTTGLVRYENQSRIQMEDKDFTVTAKVDGEEIRVTMNRYNPSARRLADSMRNLTQHQLDWFVQFLGVPSRFLSAVNTSWNPEFIITNAFRDIQSAAINIAGLERDNLLKGTMRDYRKALVAATKGEFGKGTGEWSRWYNEFKAEGGATYFNKIDNLDDLKKRIANSITKAEGRLSVKRGFLAIRDTVEALNGGVENAVRLSVYKNARELGVSKAEAASIAKNVTVNFNRRGQFGPMMNAAYMFFNASVQGTARLVLSLRSKRVQKVMAGVVVGAFMLELLNAMLSDDDDDGESYYDKISAFDKNRNFIFMIPGGNGEHIKIPMPYGYNVFASLGRTAAEVLRRGGDRATESMGDFGTAVVDAFNPVGGTESLLNLVSPTLFDPLVDLTRNRDYMDRPIMPEENQYGPQEPDAQRYFSSVSPVWRAVTDTLTSMTGGDDIVAGAIDVSPETLEYLTGTIFGAAGGFMQRIGTWGTKALDPDVDVETGDIVLVRKVFASKPSWYDRSAYYDRVSQVEQTVSDAGDYLEIGDRERFESYVNSNEQLLTLEADMKAARRDMRAIRKAKGELELGNRLGRIDDDTYRREVRVTRDAEDIVIQRFNTRWNEVMHPRPVN